MRIGVITSHRSVSLNNVADDIITVIKDSDHDAVKFGYPPTWSSSLVRDYDGYILIMTLNLIWGMPYFSFARRLMENNVPYIFYTVIEGKPKRAMGFDWVFRDINFITPSEYVKDIVEEEGGTVLDVIYHGIFPERVYNPTLGRYLRSTAGFKDNDVVVGYVAAGYPRKGHQQFASVVKQLLSADPSFRFIIVTDGGGAMWYPQDPRVKIVKFGEMEREEVYGWINAMDIYVHPSLSEGFGLPVLEALAAGKPIVHPDYRPLTEITGDLAFKVPVVKDQFIDGGDGVIYHYRFYDQEQLKRAILEVADMLQDTDWLESYKRKALARAREFDAYKLYGRMIEYLRRGI